MSERESVPEVCRFPGCGGVTRLAIYSSLAGVRILARMAGVTRFGRARKDTINVALSTGSVGVSAGQYYSGKVTSGSAAVESRRRQCTVSGRRLDGAIKCKFLSIGNNLWGHRACRQDNMGAVTPGTMKRPMR